MRHPQYDFIPKQLQVDLKLKKVPSGYDFWVDPEVKLAKEKAKLEKAEEELEKVKQELDDLKSEAPKRGRPKKIEA